MRNIISVRSALYDAGVRKTSILTLTFDELIDVYASACIENLDNWKFEVARPGAYGTVYVSGVPSLWGPPYFLEQSKRKLNLYLYVSEQIPAGTFYRKIEVQRYDDEVPPTEITIWNPRLWVYGLICSEIDAENYTKAINDTLKKFNGYTLDLATNTVLDENGDPLGKFIILSEKLVQAPKNADLVRWELSKNCSLCDDLGNRACGLKGEACCAAPPCPECPPSCPIGGCF